MRRGPRMPLAALAASGVALGLGIACTFPEIGFQGDTTGAGGGGAATASGSGGSSMASASTSSSVGTGTGGAPPCGDAGPCDCDGDGDRSSSPACGSDGGDCNDHDPMVSSKQTKFFSVAGSHGFDYDCSGSNEYEIAGVLRCPDTTLLTCDTTTVKWHGSVPDCGQMGQYGTCAGNLTLCSENILGAKLQACH